MNTSVKLQRQQLKASIKILQTWQFHLKKGCKKSLLVTITEEMIMQSFFFSLIANVRMKGNVSMFYNVESTSLMLKFINKSTIYEWIYFKYLRQQNFILPEYNFN